MRGAPSRALRAMLLPASLVIALLTAGAVATPAAAAVAAQPAIAARAAAITPAGPGPVVQAPASAVSAAALPTVQVDGVVWSQAISGNSVFAGGRFSTARPAGAAPKTHLTARGNLLSYNLTTGVLNTAFAPRLNGQVRAVAVTPNGRTLIVGGDFTTANGAPHARLAAYDIPTGKLLPRFAASVNGPVSAVLTTNTTVYLGGSFTAVNGHARGRLAAVTLPTGSLTTWQPRADYLVRALVLTPDRKMIIAGGSFKTVNKAPAFGLAALDATTGTLRPWAANQRVRDAGIHAGIMSLSTDGVSIFGTGYMFGGTIADGNLEGTFSANPSTGVVNWVEDCHGDTYGVYSDRTTVYTVGHAHYCTPVGGFPQTDPNTAHRTVAFTARTTGVLGHDQFAGTKYRDWAGTPSPSMVDWFPDLTAGTVTGMTQAAWSVAGNGRYLVLGGEFPAVNGQPQQGLVRFASRSAITAKTTPAGRGPQVTGGAFAPRLLSTVTGTVRVALPANWDPDDLRLTYSLIRNGDVAHPILSRTLDSTFWNRPTLTLTDVGLTPGTIAGYRWIATDPAGHSVTSSPATITVASRDASSGYSARVLADGATSYWRFGEPSGVVSVHDFAGFDDLSAGSGVGRGIAGPLAADATTAATFDGTANGSAATRTPVAAPATFTVQAWFSTTSAAGGRIVGFGSARTGISPTVDRHLYLDPTGLLHFGVASGTTKSILNSPTALNDGRWHQAVATLSRTGMTLSVDGRQVAANGTTTARDYWGYWRVGGDTTWAGARNLAGSIADVAVYPTALTGNQISAQYAAALAVNHPPTAAFSAQPTGLAVAVDAAASVDTDGRLTGYQWDFGDNTTGSGLTTSHVYVAVGRYKIQLKVTDNQGAIGLVYATVTVSAPPSITASSSTPSTMTSSPALSTDPTTSSTDPTSSTDQTTPTNAPTTSTADSTAAGTSSATDPTAASSTSTTDSTGSTTSTGDPATTTPLPPPTP